MEWPGSQRITWLNYRHVSLERRSLYEIRAVNSTRPLIHLSTPQLAHVLKYGIVDAQTLLCARLRVTMEASDAKDSVRSTDLGISPNRLARIAGFLHLSLIPVGVFGILYVPSTLFVPGDIATTASNIAANESLFRLSIVSALLAQVINIFVVILLYKLLKPVSKNLASLMVIFLLLGVPIAMLNELTHYATLLLVSGSEYSAKLHNRTVTRPSVSLP
ncbi:DUF4386 domain-containing protein [Halosimplex aquaticum]